MEVTLPQSSTPSDRRSEQSRLVSIDDLGVADQSAPDPAHASHSNLTDANLAQGRVQVDRRPLRLLIPSVSTRGLLAGMRIRKKLIVLHTSFSLALCIMLMVALRPAVKEVLERAELDEAKLLLDVLSNDLALMNAEFDPSAISPPLPPQVTIISGSAEALKLDAETVTRARSVPGRAVLTRGQAGGSRVVSYFPEASGVPERFFSLEITIAEARSAVWRLYLILFVTLLAVYALVALSLEIFVLPSSVYEPIRRTLAADRAVIEGKRHEELIPSEAIPDDELGEIMRSRNDSIVKLRRQEEALGSALQRLEDVANDLKRKNHLLETARRNLADADRLASLGMMSAGIAHELNTPLAVVKGLSERLNANHGVIDPGQAALMLRVVGRLERLGESLLDFARVRPPRWSTVNVLGLLRESATLIALDRESAGVPISLDVSEDLEVLCDPDRMVQVLVNLLRNASDAVRSRPSPLPLNSPDPWIVRVIAGRSFRDSRPWVTIRVIDDGAGIDPAILPQLFEPFASTRLDARGTGLGLAVAEGIVREHGGILLARNRSDAPGAVFEVVLPAEPPTSEPTPYSPVKNPVS